MISISRQDQVLVEDCRRTAEQLSFASLAEARSHTLPEWLRVAGTLLEVIARSPGSLSQLAIGLVEDARDATGNLTKAIPATYQDAQYIASVLRTTTQNLLRVADGKA